MATAQQSATDYSPFSQTPYTAPAAPTPPEITPPTPPSASQEQSMQQKPGPQIARSGGGAASVAFMLDSVLKGYMRGREKAQQKNFEKAKKLNDGLRYAYETTAQNYTSLIQSGKPPNDPEVQKADSAQRAAYQSWRQMQNNYITDGDKKSKSKSKSKGGDQSGGQQEDPMALISSKDPKEKLRGISMLQDKLFQKVGTPANAAAAPYLTPEYQEHLKQTRTQQTLDSGSQQLEGNIQKMRLRLQALEADPKADKQEVETLRRNIEFETNPAAAGKATPHYATFPTLGSSLTGIPQDALGNAIDPKGYYREETVGGESRWIPSAPPAAGASKPGSVQAMVEQWGRENGYPDPKLIPADTQSQLHKAFNAPGGSTTIHNGQVMWTDNAGNSWRIPITSSTTRSGGATMPKAKPPDWAPGAKLEGGAGAGASVGASASTGTGAHATQKSSSAKTKPTDEAANAPPVPGAEFIGKHKLSQSESKSESVVADTYKKMKPLFGLLGAQEQYMNEVKSDPAKASPRQDLSLVVAAVRAMNPGSVRLPQKELELEMKAGSWGDQASRWYEKASTGLLPEDQRNDLFKIVERETTKAGESIAADWQQYMGGQALPDDLKRFGKANAGGGNGTGGNTKSAPLTPDQKKLLDEAFPPQ